MTEAPVVFVAGATGAIGRVLCGLLVADGWRVVGTTRTPEGARRLEAQGVRPAVLDVFDEAAVRAAVLDARPSAVVHQLTDLPKRLDPAALAAALERNARLREVGTRHLVDAAAAAGVAAVVAQSIAFAYAPGPKPYTEDQPLNGADPTMARTVQGVQALERLVLGGPFRGVVLRYGRLYGPGTWAAEAPAGGPVHVDAAAHAARLALRGGSLGVYNVAEPDGTVAIDKVVGEFEWDPAFRVGLRAPGPQGAGGGDMMTREGNR